jgi:hypothetical protein
LPEPFYTRRYLPLTIYWRGTGPMIWFVNSVEPIQRHRPIFAKTIHTLNKSRNNWKPGYTYKLWTQYLHQDQSTAFGESAETNSTKHKGSHLMESWFTFGGTFGRNAIEEHFNIAYKQSR